MKRSIALLSTGNQMSNWSLKGAQLRDMSGLNLLSYVHAQAETELEEPPKLVF